MREGTGSQTLISNSIYAHRRSKSARSATRARPRDVPIMEEICPRLVSSQTTALRACCMLPLLGFARSNEVPQTVTEKTGPPEAPRRAMYLGWICGGHCHAVTLAPTGSQRHTTSIMAYGVKVQHPKAVVGGAGRCPSKARSGASLESVVRGCTNGQRVIQGSHYCSELQNRMHGASPCAPSRHGKQQATLAQHIV